MIFRHYFRHYAAALIDTCRAALRQHCRHYDVSLSPIFAISFTFAADAAIIFAAATPLPLFERLFSR